MTDWRALCAELVSALADFTPFSNQEANALAHARAALAAEPVAAPAEPTDEELALIYHDFCRGCEFIDQGGFEDAARTLLARWGHQPAPPADVTPGPSIEAVGPLIAWLTEQACQAADAGQPTDAGMLTWAAQVIGEQVDEDAPAPMAAGEAIGPEWQPCVKLPITVHVREQRSGETHVSTREGITPVRPDDLIMRGVQGEEYPIGRELFNKTYRLGTAGHQPAPSAEGEVAELVAALKRESSAYSLLNSYRRWQLKLTRAADLLEQRHPTPVPVSDRLPGAGDCDGEGRCWLLTVEDGYPQWRLHSIEGSQPGGSTMIWVPVDSSPGVMVDAFYASHWLPAAALPLPAGEVEP